MSSTDIRPIYDLGTAADYLALGVGDKKKQHLASGTNRLAPGFWCDAPSIQEFIDWGDRLAEQHGRRVKGHRLLLNFAPDELDVTNPADLQRCGDLAFELAKRAFPNSPCMVVVHDDADGGHAHAHVTILNHDLITGRAPKANRTHSAIKKLNDQLMREEGMRVITPYAAQRTDWPTRRADLAARLEGGTATRYDAFYLGIGDRVAEAKTEALAGDLDQFSTTFARSLADRGVKAIRTEHEVKTDHRRGHKQGDQVHGLQYEMVDEWTPTKRPRRRQASASKLSSEFTEAGLERAVEAERRRRALELQRQQQATAARLQQQAALAAQQPAPERDDPTMAMMRRVLDGLPPKDDQAAPATAGAFPSDGATAPTSYVSRVRELEAKGAKAIAARDSWAEFDEDAWARLQAGQRLVEDRGPGLRGAKGVGTKLLGSEIGLAFHPAVRAELERRVALLAEAKEDHESGRIEEANRKRSLVRRGIYQVPTGPTARERLVVEMAAEELDAPERDEDQLGG